MLLGFVLLVSGAGLYIYNNIESERVEEESIETVTEIETIIEENIETDETEYEELSTINIDGNEYTGIIYIPILNNLALPVLEECTDANLKISICKYAGSAEENNLVIAGHRYKSSFAKLSNLEIGNKAYYKDVNGEVYEYKLTQVETLSPTDVYEMQTGDWDMTLFTCSYNNSKRVAYRFEYDY